MSRKIGGHRDSERGAIFQGELKQTVAPAQIELGADVGAMRFNGPRADEQFRCDLPARLLLGDELQDFRRDRDGSNLVGTDIHLYPFLPNCRPNAMNIHLHPFIPISD